MTCEEINIKYGYGKSFSSFGELIQGRDSKGVDFLVTLPVDLWSSCKLIATPIKGPVIVESKHKVIKSKLIVELILKKMGVVYGYHVALVIDSKIPIGKGLSSSSADMLASLRAAEDLFSFKVTNSYISFLFNEIEPHDALHYNASVLYNHRKGVLIKDYNYIPKYTIIYVDSGGKVDTMLYNKIKTFSLNQTKKYDNLLAKLDCAFFNKNDSDIALLSTKSFFLHIGANDDFVSSTINFIKKISSLGILNTHSGTCIGFLFSKDIDDYTLSNSKKEIEEEYGIKAKITQTLNILG